MAKFCVLSLVLSHGVTSRVVREAGSPNGDASPQRCVEPQTARRLREDRESCRIGARNARGLSHLILGHPAARPFVPPRSPPRASFRPSLPRPVDLSRPFAQAVYPPARCSLANADHPREASARWVLPPPIWCVRTSSALRNPVGRTPLFENQPKLAKSPLPSPACPVTLHGLEN